MGQYPKPTSLTEIADGTGILEFGNQGISGTRVAEVEYAQLMDAVKFLLGSIVVATGGQEIVYTGDPWPGIPNLQAQRVSVKPMGKSGNSEWETNLPWTRARLTVQYNTPTWGAQTGSNSQPENAPYMIQDVDYSCEIFTIPIKATDGSEVAETKKSFRLPLITYTAEIPRVRFPSFSTIRTTNGKINTTPVFGGAAGTVLFDGPKLKNQLTTSGDYAWNVVFKFIYNEHGWNNILHPKTLTWVPADAISGSNKPYQTADLSALWTNMLI